MYACMCACMYEWVKPWMFACLPTCRRACVPSCLHACMPACVVLSALLAQVPSVSGPFLCSFILCQGLVCTHSFSTWASLLEFLVFWALLVQAPSVSGPFLRRFFLRRLCVRMSMRAHMRMHAGPPGNWVLGRRHTRRELVVSRAPRCGRTSPTTIRPMRYLHGGPTPPPGQSCRRWARRRVPRGAATHSALRNATQPGATTAAPTLS